MCGPGILPHRVLEWTSSNHICTQLKIPEQGKLPLLSHRVSVSIFRTVSQISIAHLSLIHSLNKYMFIEILLFAKCYSATGKPAMTKTKKMPVFTELFCLYAWVKV